MSEPEIARRCPSCGASIRDRALFCPQCGNAVPPRDSSQTQPLVTPAAEEKVPQKVAPASDQRVEPGDAHSNDTHALPSKESHKETHQGSQKATPVKAPANETARTSAGQAARGAVGARIQRATTLARDVEGDVIHRARQVREISSVVLDEAGDDPSLRFVLVAAVLFLLFLVIVVLNKLIS
jgi:hypothetical protein